MNNMKKKLSVLLAIVIVLTSLIIPVSADTASNMTDGAYINTGDKLYPVTKGDTYTYEYRLNLGKKLTAIDASLSYDTAGLELVNYSFPILGSSANAGTYGGKLYFNYSSATGIEVSGSSAVLIRVTFKVKAENGTFDVHTDITDMARYQEVKIVENGTVINSFNHNELITDDDSKTSIYIKTGNKYYKVKRGKTYNYICYLKTDERVGNLEATTKYSSDGLSTDKSSSYYDYYTRSVKTTYQSYSGKSFAEDNTVLVSIPFKVSDYAYDNSTYNITTSLSKLLDINEDTISRYTITEVIEGLSYITNDPNEPPTEPVPTEAPPEPTEAPWDPTEVPLMPTEPDLPHDIYLNVDGYLYEVWAGSDHTYSYYLSNAGIICGIDAVTTWNAPFITMVGEPSFPILGEEADLENPGFGGNVVSAYSNDEYGNINMLRFSYTHAEGADFSDDKAEVVTFTIHIDENTPAGIFYINTYVKTLEGEEEEKQVFEGTDTVDPPVIRNGELDGQPGERVRSYYTADDQTYATYSEEEKTFTVSDYESNGYYTRSKFRSLYIDLYGDGYYTSVLYDCYTLESGSGSIKLTLKPEYLDTISVGDYNLKFVFSDGEAVGMLHIIERTPSPTEYSEPHDPTHPEYPYHYGDGKVYFDSASAGWQNASAILFYIYDLEYGELAPWGSRKKLGGTKGVNNIWSFDAEDLGVVSGHQYYIIFNNYDTTAETYPLLLDTTCFGDTVYAIPYSRIENPVDSNKSTMEARWNRSSLGPQLRITSIGNVVGETCPDNTTPYAMLVDFLRNTLNNARDYTHRSDQQILDDIAKALELKDDDVSKAIKEAGVTVSWIPTQVTPTEPPTDAYGYIINGYYLTGTINGNNTGTSKVDSKLRFRESNGDQLELTNVQLNEGDVVRVARYNGGNAFTIYPDGVGREITIDQTGKYNLYFKPYEIGNPNYWFFTHSKSKPILGDVDGDGKVTVMDATFIQRWLEQMPLSITFDEQAADIDADGTITVSDATFIQRYADKTETPYEIGIVMK